MASVDTVPQATTNDSNSRAILDSSLTGAEKEAVAREVLTAALHLICDGDWNQVIPSSRPASPLTTKARRVQDLGPERKISRLFAFFQSEGTFVQSKVVHFS